MADFDPKSYADAVEAQAQGPAFDPVAYVQKHAPDVGPGETFLNDATNALPAGKQVVDAASTAALAALRPGPGVKLTPQAMAEAARLGITMPEDKTPGLFDTYRHLRDEREARTAAGEEQQPLAANLGKATGIGLTMLAPLPGIKVGSGLRGRVASNILTGTGYGALGGVTGSQADLASGDLGEFKKAGIDMLAGAGLGSVLGLGGGLLGEAVSYAGNKVAPKLQRFANRKALNALGATKPQLNQLGSEGGQELGQFALENGVVSPLASRETMMERALGGQKKAGENIGGALTELDQLANSAERVNSLDAAVKLNDVADKLSTQPALTNIANKFRNEADNIVSAPGAGDMTLSQFERSVARPYKKTTNWNVDLALPRETLKQLPMALEGEVERVGGNIAQRTGSDALNKYKANKQLYGKFVDLADVAEEGLKRQSSNHTFGLKEMLGLGAGLGLSGHSPTAGVLGGVTGLLATKFLNRYGDQLSATAANRLAQALSSGVGGGLAASASAQEPEIAAMIEALRRKGQRQDMPIPQGAF